MKIYDREGNVIEVQDYYGKVLNESISSARVLEKRNGQFRLGPALFWSAWGAVILGCVLTLCLFTLSMVLWSGSQVSPAWASGIGGLLAGVFSFFGMFGMSTYYAKHGVPKRLKEKPVEMYCKSCQTKLENDLELANEQRRAELLIELDQLGGPSLPALEAPDSVFEEGE
jgi:hypothetical protein